MSRLIFVGDLGNVFEKLRDGAEFRRDVSANHRIEFMQHGRRQPYLGPAYCTSCSVEQYLGPQRLNELAIYVSCHMVILQAAEKARLRRCAQSPLRG